MHTKYSCTRTIAAGVLALYLVGCTTIQRPSTARMGEMVANVRTIAIMGIDTPKRFGGTQKVSARYEELLRAKLEDAGFTVIPYNVWNDIWNHYKSEAAPLYDPTTGQPNTNKFAEIRRMSEEQMQKDHDFQARLYVAVVPSKAEWNANIAKWDGVTEPTTGSSSFWSSMNVGNRFGTLSAISLAVLIVDSNQVVYYKNWGGIQLLTHFTGRFVEMPREQLLTNDAWLVRSVDVALDPFVDACRSNRMATIAPAAGVQPPAPLTLKP